MVYVMRETPERFRANDEMTALLRYTRCPTG